MKVLCVCVGVCGTLVMPTLQNGIAIIKNYATHHQFLYQRKSTGHTHTHVGLVMHCMCVMKFTITATKRRS